VTILVLNNDYDLDGGLDSNSVAVFNGPSHGSVSISGGGAITYTPAPGFCGLDSLQYSICDIGTPLPSLCDTAWIFIDVLCVNNPPVAGNDSITMSGDSISITINVLANDTDPDNDSLIVTAIPCPPSNGTATINPNGSITYVPNPGFSGIDTLCYVVCDSAIPQGCDTGYVYINVLPGNDPPIAIDDSVSTPVNTPIVIGVQTNDSDPNGDPITTTAIVCGPYHGIAIISSGDSIFYLPAAGYVGLDTLCYVICDNAVPPLCDTAVVIINITSTNHPPVAVTDSITVTTGSTNIVPVLFNDSDPDGDSLTVTAIPCPPANGTVTINNDGTLTYEPVSGFVGVDSFCYVICDNGNPVLCDTAYVIVTVNPEDIVKIPTGFTPNGDGDNETFVILGIEDYPNNELLIFNRWGNEIYRKQGYLNEWDGRWDKNDQPLPDGTYYYLLDLGDGSKARSGYIVIFR
jgi:gliding motility-associated-like protein